LQYQPSTRRRPRFISVAALLASTVFLAGMLLSGCGQSDDNKVVATVNGEQITKGDLYDEMYAQAGHEALQGLITQTLILQEGQEKNIEITDAEIEARMDVVIQSGFSSQEEFLEMLKVYNLKQEDIERQVKIQLTTEKLLSDQIEPNEDEARQYFEIHQDQFAKPERLKARHILLETSAEAESVRAELAAGADFAQQAEEKSKDILTAGAGGDLGIINYGETIPAWQQALFGLDEGTLSEVLEGPTGFHVVEVLEKHPAEEPTYEDVKEQVHRILFEQEMSMLFPVWVKNLRAQAEIEYK
jgi:foldase protein PrsA